MSTKPCQTPDQENVDNGHQGNNNQHVHQGNNVTLETDWSSERAVKKVCISQNWSNCVQQRKIEDYKKYCW